MTFKTDWQAQIQESVNQWNQKKMNKNENDMTSKRGDLTNL